MKKSFFAENRILISRLVVTPVVVLILLLTPSITKYPLLNVILEIVGLLIVVVGVLGRIFSSLFMGNNRDQKVVSTGIYATTRNPLYFFSFVGTFGLTLAYGSLIFSVSFLVFFGLYYYKVIKSEEEYLTKHFKGCYTDYKKNTPRFFPNFKLFKIENEYVITSYKSVLKTIIDSSLILVIAILIVLLKNVSPIKGFIYIW